MADPGDILDTDRDPPEKKLPWGMILAVVGVIALVVLTVWLTRMKKNEQARAEVLTILDKELTTQEDEIKAQREKVLDLTRRLETLRTMIQTGQTPNGKAAVAEFNQLVKEQRAERDKFAQMADAYNKKVAQYKELKE